MPQSDLVIFDLDGTLLDTGADLVEGLNHALATIDVAPFENADVNRLVGQGTRVMVQRALDIRGVAHDDEKVERLLTVFLDHYERSMPGASKPYPGMLECLDRLAADGMKLAVCTNKHERLARKLLDLLDLSSRFAFVGGGDTFSTRKPDGGPILATIEKVEGATRAVMVGDTHNDVDAAKAAGVPAIVFDFGYSDVPVTTLGADRVLDSYEGLTAELVHDMLAD
ncbi:phosphoglycolate phosphatase [Pararhizobium mangrovi]|uniref:Phosphoglycolate phosphatase n=1 Tax=Pararhizobium mangrovi TaxID=2590452 RepID=A0A506UGJ1_9HYPH|nr:phosphoglycolate phosphatase [Pararhizobium mangrovi]TPW31187.1 phosphoglycolate phosphatase [Pararhizobium mangrovi]